MYYTSNDFRLYHHGVLGQKWGVRRYQNADGSLTAAGRKRLVKDIDRARKRTNNSFRFGYEAFDIAKNKDLKKAAYNSEELINAYKARTKAYNKWFDEASKKENDNDAWANGEGWKLYSEFQKLDRDYTSKAEKIGSYLLGEYANVSVNGNIAYKYDARNAIKAVLANDKKINERIRVESKDEEINRGKQVVKDINSGKLANPSREDRNAMSKYVFSTKPNTLSKEELDAINDADMYIINRDREERIKKGYLPDW